ncbi:hypothetical protein COV18_01690 [Candidatus Woesearchaeota archaeon CG10_big_fil_rev_8_21_14_0_10_37_12]|nr:MAG: hypothetical protein COV18_01690 [Candidatus Woesearchaeota archaeon CG10_big_fil_rev_8_21_14_0_10_37_12]
MPHFLKNSTYIFLLITLLACAPTQLAQQEQLNAIEPITETHTVSTEELQNVLAEFEKLDQQHNTSWKFEQVPDKIIPLSAIEPWTLQVRELQENTTDKATKHLLDARLAMLRSQAAQYAMFSFGEQGNLAMVQQGKQYKVIETIDCDDAPTIIKTAEIRGESYDSWVDFYVNMDYVLMSSKKAKELLGTGVNNRTKYYYNPGIAPTLKILQATQKALKEQCNITVDLLSERINKQEKRPEGYIPEV